MSTAVLDRPLPPVVDPPPSPAPSPSGRRPVREWYGLAALLVATAGAYLWNLTASGWANSFYTAAVQAGTESWKAFFFGSIDSSNFITVDKPPASLWVMELSGRLFGFSSASMLVPQVLEGVLTVALVYAVVRRWFGHRYGLLAGVVMATSPVAALMFRFNNPDALLVLLMTAGAYCVTRAIEKGSGRWLALAGTAIGFAFLAKMGQALIVVPAFAAAYLLAAPVGLGRRLLHLALSGVALLVSAGWWVLAVTLWPAADRPMIDGSSTNSIWNLIVEYNGLSRLSSSGGGPGGSFSGATGFLRLFNDLMGGQASWLIPAAVAAMIAGLLVTAKAPRTSRARAAMVLWGGWLLVTAAVFSFSTGIIHTYYTVALTPAIAVLVGAGAALVESRWSRRSTRLVLAGVVAVTGWWSYELLYRTGSWDAWLRPAIAVATFLSVAGLVASAFMSLRRLVAGTALVLALVAGLGGPTAFALQTISTAHTGSIPSAGPSSDGSGSFGAGGGGGTASESSALVTALETNASKYKWVAATSGSQNAATLELATGGDPVMAIGGFSGQGGNLTLAQFESYVAAGDIHYYIASGGQGGGPGGGGNSSEITSWVESHFTSSTIGGTTVYDLTATSSTSSQS